MPDPRFRHVIRWGRLYFVPRADGELVIGATNEDCGFDRSLTAGGIGGLLHEATRMAAIVGDFSLRETWTGLRPLVGDGLPVIGAAGNRGLYYALGHYRNGILLAPLTADIIEGHVLGSRSASDFDEFSPGRFSNRRHARSAS